jgi:pyruvate dehydrogenase E2 component (dihydrolipoamide acetyltransferase)
MSMKQPDNRSHFLLPDLGEGVAEAELIDWKVSPGDAVAEHQTLAEMETDKARVEVPSPWAGVVKDLNGTAGDIILVGDILVTYDIGSAVATASTPTPIADEQATEDAGTVVGNVSETLSMPSSFQRNHEPETSEDDGCRAMATPAVRRIAKDLKVDINTVAASGRGGRVTASDVDSHATPPVATQPLAPATQPVENELPLATRVAQPIEGVAERIPFRGIRRKLPFVMTAVCRALREHPAINATVDDFVEEIQIRSVINLGCAVDTDHGLMVPVLKNADELSIVQMADRVHEVARGCQDRSIDREDLTGGTFTVSNVGSYGGQFATPIINYPEVAILAIGRARERVLTKNGAFYAGLVLPLSLSCDHRVVDGAEGARFLNTILRSLEAPEKLLPAV